MDKKTKYIILIFVILIVAGVAIHIFRSQNAIENSGNKTVTDMLNRSVRVPSTIDSVIATSPTMTTIIYMIAPEKLKAVNFEWNEDELKYVPKEYQNYSVVGGWYGTNDGNYEEFISQKPDLIIESSAEGDNDLSTVQERQEKFGNIPVLAVTDSSDLDKMGDSILFIGEVLGSKEKAQELVDFNNKYVNDVKSKSSKLSDKDKKTVYYAEGDDGLKTNPSSSSHAELIKRVGGKNVADSLGQGNKTMGVQVSVEQVISWDPEVIITTSPEFYHSVYNNSNWASIKAVKNHQVYLSPQSPFKWFDRPIAANRIIGLPWTAKVIYPEQYKDIDMVKTTKEFYSKFYHVELSDDEARQILIDSGLKESNL